MCVNHCSFRSQFPLNRGRYAESGYSRPIHSQAEVHMNSRIYPAGAAVALLALGLAAGSGAASAQTGKHTHFAPLKGTIASMGAGSFQLTTTSGTVTVPFTSST